MRRFESPLGQLSVSAAVAGILSMGGCKGKEATQTPEPIQVVGVSYDLTKAAKASDAPDGKIAQYQYLTSARGDVAQALVNCVWELEGPYLKESAPVSDEHREFCFGVKESNTNDNRYLCVAIDLKKREEAGVNAHFAFRPAGMTDVADISQWSETPEPPSEAEQRGHVDIFSESNQACQLYLRAQASDTVTPDKAAVEGGAEGSVDANANGSASAGGKVGGSAEGKVGSDSSTEV